MSITKKPGSSQLKGKHYRKSIRLNSGKPGDSGVMRSSTQEENELMPSQSISNVLKQQSTFEARSQTLSPDKRMIGKI